ncbi:MAG: hypothetical protein RIR09_2712, partial [Pseudomonadota bacterium]
MLIKNQSSGFNHGQASEITDRALYQERRNALKMLATGAAGAGMAAWASRQAWAQSAAATRGAG